MHEKTRMRLRRSSYNKKISELSERRSELSELSERRQCR